MSKRDATEIHIEVHTMASPLLVSPLSAGTSASSRVDRRNRKQEHGLLMDAMQEDSTDMEREADALLGLSLILGSDSGIYSQTQLDRKARDEQKRMPLLEECGASDEMVDHLVENQVRDLIDAANLTALQEIVYRLYVAGFTGKRIAAALGIRRRTTEQRLRTVKRKVRAAYEQGRYAGWYEVYLSEVNRLAYRGRR